MIVAVLGQALLLLALLAAASGAVCAFVGGRRILRADPDRASSLDPLAGATGDRLADWSMRAVVVVLSASAGAMLLLGLALVGGDFTLDYVARRTSTDLAVPYRITAVWSGQEGSLLLWLTVLSASGALMMRSLRRAARPAALLAFATGTILTVATFFAMLVAVVARPFAVASQLQRDGDGMSPSLQNYWMAAHPPTLYLGYVGVAVPFAIVVGALLARRRDDDWVASMRVWVLVSWTFLTLGLVLGARWAYEEIGWGGYWAWDPVENAALMPWLTATALVHSVMVQQRRGMMRFWNATLASLTFGLSIFGTFITRSGVLSSVHSFVSSPVGWWFVAALAVLAASVLLLLFRSRELLRATHDVDAVVSRETALLFNNLLLVALALVVLWGVVYPIFTAALAGSRINLEKPWYDFFAAAFGLPLTVLLAFAPFIAWRGTPARRVLRSMRLPLALATAVGAALVVGGAGSSPAGVAAVCFGALVVLGVVTDGARTLRSHRAASPDVSLGAALVATAARHRRRWGAWTAHAGLGLVVIAIAGSAWGSTTRATIAPGDTVRVGGYELRLERVDRRRTRSTMQTRAVFAVRRGGSGRGELRAGRDFHPASGEVSNEVGIRHDWLRMHDLFVSVDSLTEDGTTTLAAFVNPLVPLLWLAGIITALGAVVAAVPLDPRRVGPPEDGVGTIDPLRGKDPSDAMPELRNRAPAPRELLSGVRGAPRRPTV